MVQAIHAQTDGMGADSQALQAISDEQSGLMQQLASTVEGLGATLQGAAGVAMQNCGAQLHQEGLFFATAFANHSAMMSNNANIVMSGDDDNAHLINQVANLT